MRNEISLNGYWDCTANGRASGKVRVPSSRLCVGRSTYSRAFEYAPKPGRRLLLVFEGINHQGRLTLNGEMIPGTMQPYSEYAFDITDKAVAGTNRVDLEIDDLTASFGPSEGWENYGGITRDVYLREVGEAYIKGYFLRYGLSNGYTYADCVCSLDVFTGDGAAGLTADVEVSEIGGGRLRGSAKGLPVAGDLRFAVGGITPWSPDDPKLYGISIRLCKDGEPVDELRDEIGFRDFRIAGNKFMLNGGELFLKGVCRHDTWGHGQGHTLTAEQTERDLLMIRRMGANFIRLVHYPHDRKAVRAADRLGLMVSCEPGLWWSDMSDPEVTGGALEVLRRVIVRDRNSPSVAFWLAFNECAFTDDFLGRTRRLCDENDPTRPVSGANCMNAEKTKELFDRNGWDFYTYHPYGSMTDHVTAGMEAKVPSTTIRDVVGHFKDKPLVFTEWGGWYMHDNPALMRLFCREMMRYGRRPAGEPGLAGMCYWEWADMYETNRGAPACADGILVEGLVDVDRNERVNYRTMADMFHEFDHPAVEGPRYECEVHGYSSVGEGADAKGRQRVIDVYAGIDAAAQEKAWKSGICDCMEVKGFVHKRRRRMEYGPVVHEPVYDIGELRVCLERRKPLIVNADCPSVRIALAGAHAVRAYAIGNTAMGGSYPLGGAMGDPMGRYVIRYADGAEDTVELRDGVNVTSCFGLQGPSRFDPMAPGARKCLKLTYDRDWEVYYINAMELALSSGKAAESVTLECGPAGKSLLLYGLTLVLA